MNGVVTMAYAGSRAVLWFIIGVIGLTRPPVLTAQAHARDQASPPQEKGRAIIRGRVVAEGTNTPLARIDVTAYPLDSALQAASTGTPPPRWSATTNETGAFELKGLPEGRYVVYAQVPRERPQYLSTSYGARSMFERGKPIAVADGALIDDIVIEVRRSGIITGRVINELGDPVAWVRVNALLIRGGGAEPSPTGPWRETDDLGRFRLFALQPGRYVVSAEPEEWEPDPGANPLRYVKMFYPGVSSIEEAQPVVVAGGQEPSDIEIVLRRGRTYRISGVVVSPTGQSARAQVNYLRDNNMSGVSTKPDGTFSIAGLAAGEYTVLAMTAYRRELDTEPEMSPPIRVQLDQDTDGVSLVMKRGARITGHIAVDLRTDKRPPLMRVMAASTTPSHSMMGPPMTAAVKADDTFTLSGVFGPVVLRIENGMGGRYVQSVFYKGKEITDVPTEFDDVRDAKDLEVVISDRGARISGQVADAKGTPVADAVAMAFSADERAWGSWAQSTRMAAVTASGGFSIGPLRPGKYFVFAMDPQSTSTARPFGGNETAAFAKLVSIATPVEVLENENREVSLTVTKIPQ